MSEIQKKVYITPDFHHGSAEVANFVKFLTSKYKLSKKSPDKEKIDLFSTGDFSVYKANENSPNAFDSEFVRLYNKHGAKHPETIRAMNEWAKTQGAIQTLKSAEILSRISQYLKGGNIQAIQGNSDVTFNKIFQQNIGTNLKQMYKGVVDFSEQPRVVIKGKTAMVMLPHNARVAAKGKSSKDKSYKDFRKDLYKDDKVQSDLKRIISAIKKDPNVKYVNVLMHESPSPENPKFGYSKEKIKGRLPDSLRAYYDMFVGKISKDAKGKKINVYHGHLHKKTHKYPYKSKTAKYSNVKVHNLNIGDVVEFNTETGKSTIKKMGGLAGKIKRWFSSGKPVAEVKEYEGHEKYENFKDYVQTNYSEKKRINSLLKNYPKEKPPDKKKKKLEEAVAKNDYKNQEEDLLKQYIKKIEEKLPDDVKENIKKDLVEKQKNKYLNEKQKEEDLYTKQLV